MGLAQESIPDAIDHGIPPIQGLIAACSRPLLLNPYEGMRSYSSVYGSNDVGAGHARSMLESAQAWSAAINREGEWMQIDLGRLAPVLGVVVQGRAGQHAQWVTKYSIVTSGGVSEPWSFLPELAGSADKNS